MGWTLTGWTQHLKSGRVCTHGRKLTDATLARACFHFIKGVELLAVELLLQGRQMAYSVLTPHVNNCYALLVVLENIHQSLLREILSQRCLVLSARPRLRPF